MSKPKKYYYKDGSISDEKWYINDKLHRTDGPAVIYYYENGSIYSEEWWVNGKFHRTDGPAYIQYRYNGDTVFKYEQWWVNSKKLTEEKLKEHKWNLAFDKELTKELSAGEKLD